MPMYVVKEEISSQLDNVSSALIVPCRFCPAASAAVASQEPYIEMHRRLLRTAPYERQLDLLERSLEERGIRVDVFESRLPHQYVLCMWTARRRRRLLERARRCDVVIVMGCEAATASVRVCLAEAGCRVIAGMRSEGLMSIKPRFSLPATVQLDLEGVTHMEVGGYQ